MPNRRSSSSNYARKTRGRSNDYNLRSQCDGTQCNSQKSHSPRRAASSLSPTDSRRGSTPRSESTPRRSRSYAPRSRQPTLSPLPRSESTPLRHRTPSSWRSSSAPPARRGSTSRRSRTPHSRLPSLSPLHTTSRLSASRNTSSKMSASAVAKPSAKLHCAGCCCKTNSSSPAARSLSSPPGLGHEMSHQSILSTIRSKSLSRSHLSTTRDSSSITRPPSVVSHRSCTPTAPRSILKSPASDKTGNSSPDHSWALLRHKSADAGMPYLLEVANQLKVKTTSSYSFDDKDQLIVDCQTTIMPKDFTEIELQKEIELLEDQHGTVFGDVYTDGEEVMEMAEFSVMNTRNAIFIRRKSTLTLAGGSSTYQCHPLPKVSRAHLLDQYTWLHVESIYSSVRNQAAISRKEVLMLTFDDHGCVNSHEIQRRLKDMPSVEPPHDHGGIYLLERADFIGPVIILERDMQLKKTLWKIGRDFHKELIGNHSLYVMRPSIPTPVGQNPDEKTSADAAQPTAQPQLTPTKPRVSDTVMVSPPPRTLDDARSPTFRSVKSPPTPAEKAATLRVLFTNDAGSLEAKKKTPHTTPEKQPKTK